MNCQLCDNVIERFLVPVCSKCAKRVLIGFRCCIPTKRNLEPCTTAPHKADSSPTGSSNGVKPGEAPLSRDERVRWLQLRLRQAARDRQKPKTELE